MKAVTAVATLALLLQQDAEPTGEQLIEKLKDEATRASAFYQLARRAGEDDAKTETAFRERRRNPELVICPQGEGKPPLYVLLSDFLPRAGGPEVFGGVEDQLFKAAAPTVRKKKKVIDAFTATGKRATPFGGNNVVDDGLFADLNRDGSVLRVDSTHYSAKNRDHVAVLEVHVVREKAEPIFSVVYVFGARSDWGYDFADEDGDGSPEIQLGPKTLEGQVVPRASFKWDPVKKTYAGPKGGPGDHFRVIQPGKPWQEFKRLVEEKTEFPPEEDPASLRKVPPARIPADTAYAYRSLKGRTDEELFAAMARLDRGSDRVGTREPSGFWSMDPKAAALALVNANRSARHSRWWTWRSTIATAAGPGRPGSFASRRCPRAAMWRPTPTISSSAMRSPRFWRWPGRECPAS